jgi:sugar transferase EpsL
VKRAFDLILTLATAIFWLPLLLVVTVLVRIKLGSPVFFRQQRPGLNGKPFRMVKFRSMTDARDANGNLLPDEDRLPAFGRWLRASSMDELPELFNVLKGEMSLVGPRPLLMQYLPRYNARQARRHEVPPGITGWAQVNGRNAIAWDQKFELDIWYVENRSLWLDCKIILLTILKLFRRDDVNAPGAATMPEFMGNQDLLRKN